MSCALAPLTLLVCAALTLAQGPSVECAWQLLAKGQRAEAVHLLYGIVAADRRNAAARLLLGSVLMEEGQRSESIAQLTAAVRLRPDSAEAQNALGEALNAFGDARAARGPFERAAALDPHFAPAQVNLGLVLIKSGEFSAAAPHLDRAIDLLGQSRDAAYPHYLRARIYTERGRIARAATDLQQAVTLEPNFAEAWSDLGEARTVLLDDPGALSAFEKAVGLAPKDPVGQTRLGLELLHQGDARQAVPHLEEAVRLDPHNQSALYGLEHSLRDDGHPRAAEATGRELAALLHRRDQADQNAFAAIQLNDQGAALEKSGNLREALAKYRAALALDPEHVGIRVNLAAVLLRLGQWNEAVAELHEVLKSDPNNRAVREALDEALAHPPPGR